MINYSFQFPLKFISIFSLEAYIFHVTVTFPCTYLGSNWPYNSRLLKMLVYRCVCIATASNMNERDERDESLFQVSTDGVMSPLSFDQYGSPVHAEYDIVNFGRTGFIKVSAEFYHHKSTRGSRLIGGLSMWRFRANERNRK